jgi:hypothetical protein
LIWSSSGFNVSSAASAAAASPSASAIRARPTRASCCNGLPTSSARASACSKACRASARLRRQRDLQRLPGQSQRPRVVALPQRQHRQVAERATFHGLVAIGAQHLQRRFQVAPGLCQVTQAQPASAQVRQADGFVDPVAPLALDLQRLLDQFDLGHQIALQAGSDRERIQQTRLDPTQAKAARLGQALQCQRTARPDVALPHQRRRHQPLREQAPPVVAGSAGAVLAPSRGALHRRPIGHPHCADGAPPGHLGAPAVVIQLVGQPVQGIQVGPLLVAQCLHVQRVLARTQQPPAQFGLVRLVGPQQRQRPLHVRQHAVVREALLGQLGGAGVKLGGVGGVACLLEVLGRP